MLSRAVLNAGLFSRKDIVALQVSLDKFLGNANQPASYEPADDHRFVGFPILHLPCIAWGGKLKGRVISWICCCREHFSHEQVFNACYSHAWDPSQARLAAVGGPLAYGLRGTYMSVWS